MNVENSKDALVDLLVSAGQLCVDRMSDCLDDLTEEGVTFLPLHERVELIKSFGIVRLAVGRRSGMTTAAVEFINKFYPSERVVYLCPDKPSAYEFYTDLGAVEVVRWSSVEHLDPRGIVAMVVDPGPHAGPQARDAIYRCAAEAMLSRDDTMSTVVIYFVGT